MCVIAMTSAGSCAQRETNQGVVDISGILRRPERSPVALTFAGC